MVSHSTVLTISGHISISFPFVLVIVYHIMPYLSRGFIEYLHICKIFPTWAYNLYNNVKYILHIFVHYYEHFVNFHVIYEKPY